MATVAKLNVQIGAELSGLQKSLKTAGSSLESFGKKASEIGKSMSTKLTAPLVGFATASVFAFDKQAKAVAQVEQAIVSTGGAANRTSKELQDMASSLQKNSLFGDEEILQKVTAQLLTFTNISGTAFDRTQQAALDLATRLGGDLQGASIQLGKALNDPVANLSALSRSGIQFSEDQKALIDSLVKTNRLADAQTVILDELEKQYGGSAKAAAEAGSGGITQLKNSFGDLMEQIGEVVVEAINPFVKRLKEIVEQLQQTDKETLKFYITVGALAAAIGPLLFVVGKIISVFGVLTKSLVQIGGVLQKVGLAFKFVLSPIFLKIAAVMALILVAKSIYDTFEPLQAFFKTLWNSVMSIFQSAINGIIRGWNKARDVIAKIVPGITESVVESFEWMDESVGGKLSEFGGNVQTNFMSVVDTIKGFVSNVTDGFNSFTKSTDEASTSLDKLNKKSSELTAPTFAFSGGIDRVGMNTEGKLKQQAVDPARYAESMGVLGSKIKKVSVDMSAVNMQTEQMSVGFELLKPLADEFVNSFAQGMANVIMQGQKLTDMLKDIGKMLLSSAIQTGIKLLLSGGLSSAGTGFFGSGKGLLGSIFGVNDALIQSNGNIVKFHPDDNILAMKDFSGLGGGGGGSVSAIRVSVDTIRVSGSDILIALKNTERAYG